MWLTDVILVSVQSLAMSIKTVPQDRSNDGPAAGPHEGSEITAAPCAADTRAIGALRGSRHKAKHRVEASWESTGCQGRIPAHTRCSVAVALLAAGMSYPQEQRRPLPQPAELA